jgi:hypothetical protein
MEQPFGYIPGCPFFTFVGLHSYRGDRGQTAVAVASPDSPRHRGLPTRHGRVEGRVENNHPSRVAEELPDLDRPGTCETDGVKWMWSINKFVRSGERDD